MSLLSLSLSLTHTHTRKLTQQPTEFAKSIDIEDLTLPAHGVLIIWKWDGCLSCNKSESSASSTHSTDTDEENTTTPPSTEEQTHTVTFKVIGCNKERGYQDVLHICRDNIQAGQTVSVKLTPEPKNPFNSRAIAFVCLIDGRWCRIGYVVNKILEEIHQALAINEILSVKFSWVKYITHWSRILCRSGCNKERFLVFCRGKSWQHKINRTCDLYLIN